MSIRNHATPNEARLLHECREVWATQGFDVKFIAAPDMLEAWCCESQIPLEFRSHSKQHIYRHVTWRELIQLVNERLTTVYAELWLKGDSPSRRA